MDERDEDGYESETETFADPVTERVRIIGAEAVGTAPVGQGTPSTRAGSSPGAAAYPDDVTDPVTSLEGRSVAPSGSETDEVDRWSTPDSGGLGPRRSVTGWLDEGGDAFDEPASVDGAAPLDRSAYRSGARRPRAAQRERRRSGILVGIGGCRPGLAGAPARVGRQRVRPVAPGRRDDPCGCDRGGTARRAPAVGVRRSRHAAGRDAGVVGSLARTPAASGCATKRPGRQW